MVQWTYLCVIFHVKHKTYHFRGLHLISKSSYNLRWRPRWWQLLVTSQASSSATTHKIYLTLLRRSKDFHWKQNHLEILQHIKNFRKGFQPPPPPIPCTTVEVWICMYFRGLRISRSTSELFYLLRIPQSFLNSYSFLVNLTGLWYLHISADLRFLYSEMIIFF